MINRKTRFSQDEEVKESLLHSVNHKDGEDNGDPAVVMKKIERPLVQLSFDVPQEEELYYEVCKRLDAKPLVSFISSMRSRSDTFRCLDDFTERDLLAIADFLLPPVYSPQTGTSLPQLRQVHIPPHWNFSGCNLGSEGLVILTRMLSAHLPIESLNVSHCGIGPRGFRALAKAIRSEDGITPTLRELDLSRNKCAKKDAITFADAIMEGGHSLTSLNMSNCSLTFPGESAVRNAVNEVNLKRNAEIETNMEAILYGNLLREELWNSITHGVGFILAIVGTIILMLSLRGAGIYRNIGGLVYCLTLLATYMNSMLYHSFSNIIKLKNLMQKLDHCTVYLLIAGTYTPICMVVLYGNIGWILLALVWAQAILGITLNIVAFHRFKTFKLILYLVMGWTALCILPPWITYPNIALRQTIPLILLVAGGLSYTIGVIFFVKDEKKPILHAIWHIFVLFGSLFHYFLVFFYIIHADFPNPPIDQFVFTESA